MGISITQPGLLTTVQDGGRYGYQKEGIIVSGAMDKLASRIGNLLVGNNEKEAGLEITQLGPTILFQESCVIAITGACLSPVIRQSPVPMWRPVYIRKGSILEFGRPLKGCRAYITFSGGLDVPEVLGSKSTYLRAKIGGWHGRALQRGDHIPYKKSVVINFKEEAIFNKEHGYTAAKWSISPLILPAYKQNPVIRVIRGPEYGWFTAESQYHFWQTAYTITHQSDRMGYRLRGNTLSLQADRELISSAVTFGSIQVPSNGSPIILMADHQTTGGYPRIGQVISSDFSLLAQAAPGSVILFREVSLQEAQQLYITQEKNIRLIRMVLARNSTGDLFQ